MKVSNYKELIVWKKSMILVKKTYEIVDRLPAYENYALSEQMRRSAISIPSNIAEGCERESKKEFVRFLSIANGSKSELLTQLEICKMLGYCSNIEEVEKLCQEIGKMLNSIINKLTTIH